MIKQVIVIRKDLNMRRGKEIAQGSHASMAFMTNRLKLNNEANFSVVEWEWINGLFTKICLQVGSESELLDIYEKAQAMGLETHIITDSGKTEFGGLPTKTCLAIGPDSPELIDLVTGHLKVY